MTESEDTYRKVLMFENFLSFSNYFFILPTWERQQEILREGQKRERWKVKEKDVGQTNDKLFS